MDKYDDNSTDMMDPLPDYQPRRSYARSILFAGLLVAVVALVTTAPFWITTNEEEAAEGLFAPDVLDAEPDAENTQDLNGNEEGAIDAEDEMILDLTPGDLDGLLKQAETLKVAWIMSFGGSGTSYTIMNMEKMSGATTATNYGRDLDPCLPVHSNWTDGPFLHTTSKEMPNSYILTKTHCGGYCMDCAPSAYVMDAATFDEQCRTGTKPSENKDPAGVAVLYSRDIPQKAVHLIRNPFDNLVSRMHLSYKVQSSRGSEEIDDAVGNVTDKDDFASWCNMLHENYNEREHNSKLLNNSFLNRYQDLPCHSEWFKYVQWHNNAEEVIAHLKLPFIRMKYEQYGTDFDTTVEELFSFMELEARHDPLEFIEGLGYSDYWSEDDKKLAAKMVKEMASPAVWDLLQDYFVGYVVDDDDDDDDVDSGHAKTPVVTDDKDAAKVAPTPYFEAGDDSEVAWLLSFPNSGTSYTITNTEHMTNGTTASNYADDWEYCIPVRPELIDNGPYLHNLHLPVPRTVLTKTHCTGYCDDCSPNSFVNTLDTFEDGCLSGKMNKDGELVHTMYNESVPVAIVHLIRNPFDNIVSRLHLALDRRAKQGWSQEELDAISDLPSWCNYIDGMYDIATDYSKTLIVDDEIKQLFEAVPCHDEWYRYVQWHNLAVEMTDRLDVPLHYLRYEEYSSDYNATTKALYKFLGLDMTGKPLEFDKEKTYDDLYDEEDKKAAKRLVYALATEECWALLEPYFEGIDA